jgi:hypothetical protein
LDPEEIRDAVNEVSALVAKVHETMVPSRAAWQR